MSKRVTMAVLIKSDTWQETGQIAIIGPRMTESAIKTFTFTPLPDQIRGWGRFNRVATFIHHDDPENWGYALVCFEHGGNIRCFNCGSVAYEPYTSVPDQWKDPWTRPTVGRLCAICGQLYNTEEHPSYSEVLHASD